MSGGDNASGQAAVDFFALGSLDHAIELWGRTLAHEERDRYQSHRDAKFRLFLCGFRI